ncbi:hypothetical protein V6N13_047299 [Hibiscus sabdariffa]
MPGNSYACNDDGRTSGFSESEIDVARQLIKLRSDDNGNCVNNHKMGRSLTGRESLGRFILSIDLLSLWFFLSMLRGFVVIDIPFLSYMLVEDLK